MSESEEFRERLATAFIRRTLPEHYNPNADQTVMALAALTLAEALDKHGEALTRASAASDQYAKGIKLATWGLFGATAALALATVVLIAVTWLKA